MGRRERDPGERSPYADPYDVHAYDQPAPDHGARLHADPHILNPGAPGEWKWQSVDRWPNNPEQTPPEKPSTAGRTKPSTPRAGGRPRGTRAVGKPRERK